MQTETTVIDLSSLSGFIGLSSLLESGEIEEIAKSCGFVCRSSSRISGTAFLQMMTQMIDSGRDWSLMDQCFYLEDKHNIVMSKQGLDARYHTFSVLFMKRCYEKVFSLVLSQNFVGLKTCFDNIYVTDSTSFQLPAKLASFYCSNGGDTTGSSIKIHQTVELQTFSIKELQIGDGNEPDVNYQPSSSVSWGTNSLYIRDLGYYKFAVFEEIASKGDYFLSRYKTNTNLYVKNEKGKYVVLDLNAHLKSLDGKSGASDLTIYIGKSKVQGRLICEAVPQEVKAQRLEKYRQCHQRQSKKHRKWEMTEQKKLLCGYNLFITNTPEEKLPTDLVFLIYSLRWQVELLFKIWKSLLHIHQVEQMNIFRFECFLYGRLIFILLSTQLLAFVKDNIAQSDIIFEISDWKAMKIIKKKSINYSNTLALILKKCKNFCAKSLKESRIMPKKINENATTLKIKSRLGQSYKN